MVVDLDVFVDRMIEVLLVYVYKYIFGFGEFEFNVE